MKILKRTNFMALNIKKRRRLLALIVCLSFTPSIHAKDASVSQTGNIVYVKSEKYGDHVLIGDPGLQDLSDYEFSIEINDKKLPPTEKDSEPPDEAQKSEEQPDISLLLRKANELYNERKFLEALRIVEEAAILRPDSAKAKAMRGSLKSVLGDSEGAKRDWLEASQLEISDQKLKRQLESQLPRPE